MVKTLGQKLRELRLSKGLAMDDIANKIAGVTRGYISTVELDKKTPSLQSLEKILDAMDCELKIEFVPKGTLSDEEKTAFVERPPKAKA